MTGMKFGVIDIESENWIRFRTIGLFDGQVFKHFESLDTFLKYIDRKAYNGFRFYAHNGGKFDFLFLLEPLLRSCQLRFMERHGRIISIRATMPKGNVIHFVDSYAMLPDSLKNLTTAFDVNHKKKAFTFIEGKKVTVTKRLIDYLEHDCIGLFEVLETFFNMPFIGSPQYTIASQALHTFTHEFLDADLLQTTPKIETVFREQFYSGGRVEVYKGIGKVNVYDVNSLFPFVMLNEMPVGTPKLVRTFDERRIGFYVVEIRNTPDFYIPPYLKKVERGTFRKNYFVNGNGVYYMSGDMLKHLRDTYGVKFRIHSGYVFPERKAIFTDYVNHFFSVKAANKGNAMERVAKLMLNSLYGKFAMNRFRESLETFRGQEAWQLPDNQLMHEYGLVLIERESKSKFILPYIAAYITDLARLHHWKLMQHAPEAMYYCDTDSLFTSATYPHGKDIGQLDLKGTFNGVFFGAKSYALKNRSEERVMFKGFKPDKFTYADLKEALKHGKVLQTEETRIASFRESFTLKPARITESQGKFLNLISVKKRVLSEYDKRQVLDSKKHFFDTEAFTNTQLEREGNDHE